MDGPPRSRAPFLGGAVVVLLVGTALRLWALDRLPGGLHFDLGANLLDVVDVLNGTRLLYFTRNNGREPLVIYLQAAAALSLGPTPYAARLVTVAFGILSVAATGFAARQAMLLARPTERARADAAALLAAASLAGLYWSVHFSRFGLRTALVPALLALAFGCALRGLRAAPPTDAGNGTAGPGVWRGTASLLAAGLFLGLAIDTYTGARLAVLALGVPFIAAAALERRIGHLARLAVAVLGAAASFAPLGLHYLRNPGDFSQHTYDTSVLNPALSPDPVPLAVLRGLATTAGGYVLAGSPGAGENLPGRPIFDPIAALAFLLGLGVLALWARRSGRGRLVALALVGWLATMSLASALAVPSPGFVRISGAIPAAAVVAALGTLGLAEWLGRRVSARGRRLPIVVATALCLFSAALTARDYFGVWAAEHAYRGAIADKADAAAWLAAAPPDQRIFLAPLWATDFGVRFLTRERPPESFDNGGGAVIPTGSAGGALYAYPAEQVLEAEELRQVLPGHPPIEVVRDRTGQVDLLRVLRLPAGARPPIPIGVQPLEDGVDLAGTAVRHDADRLIVTLTWRARARPSRDYTVFVQLRDERGTRAQHDGQPVRGSVPATRWRPGDVVLDRHDLNLPEDEPTGAYRLAVGMYDLASGRRLRLLDAAGQPAPVDEVVISGVDWPR